MAIDKVEYWRELADYDIETAEVMYGGGRWLYVGFMCHQVIEKTIKAYWSKIKPDEVPFIAELMPMNIEARYPSYKEELAKKLTPDYCRTIIDKTRELKLWIEKQL